MNKFTAQLASTDGTDRVNLDVLVCADTIEEGLDYLQKGYPNMTVYSIRQDHRCIIELERD